MTTGIFIERAAAHLLAPFESLETFLVSMGGAITAVTDLRSRTAWIYLITSLLIAVAVYAVGRQRGSIERQSVARFLFPRDVYGQRSALVDYKFVAIDLTIKAILYAPLLTGISIFVHWLCEGVVSRVGLRDFVPELIPSTIAVPVAIILSVDFVLFLYHYLMHRVPILWYFHEVHHSAEVLTPVTVYRMHPVEDLVHGVVGSVIWGVGGTIFAHDTDVDRALLRLFGINAAQFFFFSFAFQLRHSHIWLSYGSVLSRVFISPAQHQVHHSLDPRHWNKNYGFVFAFWDALFRSLYVPKSRENLSFGLPGADPADFSTVSKLYLLPFVKAARLVRTRLRQALQPAVPLQMNGTARGVARSTVTRTPPWKGQ